MKNFRLMCMLVFATSHCVSLDAKPIVIVQEPLLLESPETAQLLKQISAARASGDKKLALKLEKRYTKGQMLNHLTITSTIFINLFGGLEENDRAQHFLNATDKQNARMAAFNSMHDSLTMLFYGLTGKVLTKDILKEVLLSGTAAFERYFSDDAKVMFHQRVAGSMKSLGQRDPFAINMVPFLAALFIRYDHGIEDLIKWLGQDRAGLRFTKREIAQILMQQHGDENVMRLLGNYPGGIKKVRRLAKQLLKALGITPSAISTVIDFVKSAFPEALSLVYEILPQVAPKP